MDFSLSLDHKSFEVGMLQGSEFSDSSMKRNFPGSYHDSVPMLYAALLDCGAISMLKSIDPVTQQ